MMVAVRKRPSALALAFRHRSTWLSAVEIDACGHDFYLRSA